MNNLKAILHLLIELHVSLLETVKKKHKILISGEINPLLSILSDESKLIKKIKEADKRRIEVLGEGADKTSLKKIIEIQPDGDEKKELISIYDQLKILFQEVESVNGSNQQLLQQSLAFTQYMIEQMLPMSEGSGQYSSVAGSKEMKESVRLFDAKA
jgi:flagellar biosynthesis/type III secretory pathway chaperone